MEFPVLGFSYARKYVEVIFSEEELTQANAIALKKGYFNNLLIIDCKGAGYVVRNVRIVCFLWASIFLIFVNGRKYRVTLEFDEIEAFSTDDIKSMVCASIEADPDFWSAVTGDCNDIKTQVRQAKTFDGIMKSLC